MPAGIIEGEAKNRGGSVSARHVRARNFQPARRQHSVGMKKQQPLAARGGRAHRELASPPARSDDDVCAGSLCGRDRCIV